VVGSIGVIGMNVNIEKLLRDKLGVEAQAIKSSDATYKDVPSMFRPMTDDERKYVQKMIDDSQDRVNGVVRVKLYKGNVIVIGRKSERDSLFDSALATFEDDAGSYNQADAAGFIRLNALRMRVGAKRDGRG
jgi:argininosuccinate synthase